MAHLILFCKFDEKTIPRRWDIVIHHLFAFFGWLIIEFPYPIYLWTPVMLSMMMEISTTWLNLQWFGKFYKHKRLEKYSQYLFVLFWFIGRVPMAVYINYYVLSNWTEIWKELPIQVAAMACFTCIAAAGLLQLIWTVFIAHNLIKRMYKNDKNQTLKTVHMHGVSLSDVNKIKAKPDNASESK